ncbi:MAG: hypothetical protein HN368_14150 [Spirochaetales bacterium]|jgi:tetratricopeptide (TPR) repeat protein|nr:hypothetical protein [Spirochaetales bacterium]
MTGKIIFAALSLMLLTTTHTFAKEPAEGAEEFHELVDSWINDEINSETLIGGINLLEGAIIAEGDTWVNLYWRARIALIRGQIYYENKDKEASLAELKESHLLIRKSISIQEHSDSWRVMSESSSLIMVQRGVAYIILNFMKAQNQAKKSIELDPENARAHLVVAQFLTNAPRIAGGNRKKGIRILQDQLSRSDLIDEDRFLLFLTLSEALERNKQSDEALVAYQEALNIFPGYRLAPTVVVDLE